MRNRKSKSFYFYMETRLRWNDWTPAERAVFVALCQLAAENGGTGAFLLHKKALKDAVAAFDFMGKAPTLRAVSATLLLLSQRETETKGNFPLYIFSNDWVFLRDFWSQGHSVDQPTHKAQLEMALESMPADVRDKVRSELLSKQPTESPNKAHKQNQEKEKEQKQPPIPQGGPASAAPSAGATGGRVKPKALALAELESQLQPETLGNWRTFTANIAAENKRGDVAESRLANILSDFLDRMLVKGQFFDAGLEFGLSEANRRGIANPGYVISVAKNNPQGELKRQYGVPGPGLALPPPQSDDAARRERARQSDIRIREEEAAAAREIADCCQKLGLPTPGPMADDARDKWLREKKAELAIRMGVAR